MAACLITITGTSGKVLLKYNESAVAKNLIADIGSVYLDDATVTDLTWTTLYGDAVASSACFSETELPMTCYHMKWDYSNIANYNFSAVVIDGIELPISPVSYPDIKLTSIATAINELEDDSIKAVEGKIDSAGLPNFTLVLKTLSVNPPMLKVDNNDGSASFYIIGEAGTCDNVGFMDFSTCQTIILS